MADRHKEPLYAVIAATLREEIAERALVPGDRLPTEARLAERFGVNRHTVRHALEVLGDEGLTRSRRGSGTTVLARPLDYRIGPRVRFHENLLTEGRRPMRTVLAVERQSATARDARILKIAAGDPVCLFEAVSFADGTPIAFAHSRFPERRLPGIAHALRGCRSVTEALKGVGLQDYTRASTRLVAELATATLALHLSVRQGDPVIHASSVNVDADGRPIEHGQTWFAGARVTLTVDMPGAGDAPPAEGPPAGD